MAGQQQIVSGRGSGARGGPKSLQQAPHAGPLRGQPQGAGESELSRGRGEGKRGGVLLNQFGEFFSRAEIGLLNDAGLAVDAALSTT